MRRLLALLAFLPGVALAAPADDGQTAGSRAWILYQGRQSIAVTPADGSDLVPAPTRFLYNGTATACNIAVRFADDGTTSRTLNNVQAGALLPIQVNRVLATGTTCTNIVAIY